MAFKLIKKKLAQNLNVDHKNSIIFYVNFSYVKIVFVYRYNTLRTKTHQTEFQLIIKEVEEIDNLINYAQNFITWKSEGKRKRLINISICTNNNTFF